MEHRACARCNNVMDRATVSAVEVDRCPSCGAIWLDKGELGALVKADPEAVSAMVAEGGGGDAPPLHAAIRLDCPACKGKLMTLEWDGQRLDRCEGCGGILFERDGLEKGIASLRAEWQRRQA
jgi:Zn-finger nucleic acid-binding protein